MTFNRITVSVLIALSLLLLLPFGCGDDKGDPPEDAFDSQGVDGEVVQKPSVSVAGFDDEGRMSTAESTITLQGAALDAETVTVDGEAAELGETFGDDAVIWSMEVALTEGDNALQIKAQDTDGLESDPLDVVVVYDPDYVPNPPENSGTTFVDCSSYASIGWRQKHYNYDPPGSRPDEIVLNLSSNLGDAYFYFNSRNDTTVNVGTVSKVTSYLEDRITSFSFGFLAWEKDDGFFTGGSDSIGSGSIYFDVRMERNMNITTRGETYVGGNSVWVDLSVSCVPGS